jgi:hypothetical protein
MASVAREPQKDFIRFPCRALGITAETLGNLIHGPELDEQYDTL